LSLSEFRPPFHTAAMTREPNWRVRAGDANNRDGNFARRRRDSWRGAEPSGRAAPRGLRQQSQEWRPALLWLSSRSAPAERPQRLTGGNASYASCAASRAAGAAPAPLHNKNWPFAVRPVSGEKLGKQPFAPNACHHYNRPIAGIAQVFIDALKCSAPRDAPGAPRRCSLASTQQSQSPHNNQRIVDP